MSLPCARSERPQAIFKPLFIPSAKYWRCSSLPATQIGMKPMLDRISAAVGELERDRREQTPLLVEPERDLERGFRLRGRLARVAPSGAREQQGEARVQPAQRLRLLAEELLSTVEPPEVHAGGGGVQAAEAVGEIEQLRRRRERGALRPLQLLDLRVERRKGAVDLGDARGAAAALPRLARDRRQPLRDGVAGPAGEVELLGRELRQRPVEREDLLEPLAHVLRRARVAPAREQRQLHRD